MSYKPHCSTLERCRCTAAYRHNLTAAQALTIDTGAAKCRLALEVQIVGDYERADYTYGVEAVIEVFPDATLL